jgi:hypothetical protein
LITTVKTVDTTNTIESKEKAPDEAPRGMSKGGHRYLTPGMEGSTTQWDNEAVGSLFTMVLPTEKVIQRERMVTHGSERTFTTMQMGASSLFRLSVKRGDTILEAAVDTVAELTIISSEMFQNLEHRPQVLRETTMHAAGRGMVMKTLVVDPVSLQIGSKSYATDVYVAPIKDEILLGLNFMVEYMVWW